MCILYYRIGPMRLIKENKISDLIRHEIACLYCKVHTLMNENGNYRLTSRINPLKFFRAV
jgi:hypothetical protein